MKSIFVVAKNTYLELIRDRILYLLIFFAVLLLGFSLALGQLSFSEQARISSNFGLTGMHLGAIMLSIFVGSSLVSKEIEKQTILTLLVRPVSREQFLIGKFIGLALVVFTVLMGLSALQLITNYFLEVPILFNFAIAVYGIFVEALLLMAVTMFFGTFSRPTLVVSFSICLFLIGHWLNNLAFLAEKSHSEVFQAFASVVLAALPNLEEFNWRAIAIYDVDLPLAEVAMATIYASTWGILLFLLSVMSFRKKDFV